MAESVSVLRVPRDPRTKDTRAMVVSSGASSTVQKSYCPSSAHCATTRTPMASTSAFTALRRSGFSVRVAAPSGPTVESMRKVAMGARYRSLRGAPRSTEVAADHLPQGVAGQGVDEAHLARAFEGCQLGCRQFVERVEIGIAHHVGDHGLAPLGGGRADDSHLDH